MDKSHRRHRKFRDSSDRSIRGQENFSVNSSTNVPSERRRDDHLRQNSKD